MTPHPSAPRRTDRPGEHRGKARTRQAAFSLIELMIAITIALFLVLGLATILFSVRKTFTTQDQLTRMQENDRFLITVLNHSVRDAGYFINPLIDTVQTALPATTKANPDGSLFAAGEIVTGTTGAAAGSDSLNTRYQTAANDTLMNCEGGTNTSAGTVTYINSFAVNANRQLTCTVTANGVTGPPSVLVDNVGLLKILYGVDTDTDGSVDTYLSSADVAAGNFWQAVGSAQIAVTQVDLVNSLPGTSVNLPQPLIHTINLMNKG